MRNVTPEGTSAADQRRTAHFLEESGSLPPAVEPMNRATGHPRDVPPGEVFKNYLS